MASPTAEPNTLFLLSKELGLKSSTSSDLKRSMPPKSARHRSARSGCAPKRPCLGASKALRLLRLWIRCKAV